MSGIMDVGKYFESLTKESYRAYELAKQARAKGLDPTDDVEIALTKDVASRVEGLLELKGIGDSIRKMEKEGKDRFTICSVLAIAAAPTSARRSVLISFFFAFMILGKVG